MKGEIVRSIECNSTISPFLGRWQNLNWISKTHGIIHKEHTQDNNWDWKEDLYSKKIHVHELQWYKKNTKNLILLPLLSIRPERKEEKELEIRMFTSFSADRIRTRGVMVFKMNNRWRNEVILCRREVANTFKKGKELNKEKHVVTWKSRVKNAGEF